MSITKVEIRATIALFDQAQAGNIGDPGLGENLGRTIEPLIKPLGFNCPEYTREFGDRLTRIFSFDYPVLFWLKGILAEGCRVFDLGGHVGLQYYAFSKE